MSPKESIAWKELESHASLMKQTHISTLFKENTQRFDALNFSQGELLLDLSKQRISNETIALLIKLAEDSDLRNWVNNYSREATSMTLKIDPPCTQHCVHRKNTA